MVALCAKAMNVALRSDSTKYISNMYLREIVLDYARYDLLICI